MSITSPIKYVQQQSPGSIHQAPSPYQQNIVNHTLQSPPMAQKHNQFSFIQQQQQQQMSINAEMININNQGMSKLNQMNSLQIGPMSSPMGYSKVFFIQLIKL